jgi:hypothetical protein
MSWNKYLLLQLCCIITAFARHSAKHRIKTMASLLPNGTASSTVFFRPRSVLAWPAWLRVLTILPALVLMWLALLSAKYATGPVDF